MAQRYLPAVTQGSKGVLIINGSAIPSCLARLPQHENLRANLTAGGIGIVQPLTFSDWRIAETVGSILREKSFTS